jgi:hypothetical protein
VIDKDLVLTKAGFLTNLENLEAIKLGGLEAIRLESDSYVVAQN